MGNKDVVMRITGRDLDEAVSQGLLSTENREELEAFLVERSIDRGEGLRFVSLAYYLGAMVVISALTWFVADSWDRVGGWGLSAIAFAYGCGFAAAGFRFYGRSDTKTLGGLLITMSVCLTPLFTYGLQKATGLWTGSAPGEYVDFFNWVRSGWCVMEISTVLVGLIAMKYVSFPFLVAPVSFSLWFLSMDITPLLGVDHRVISLVFGIFMIGFALWWDLREDVEGREYGFWLHLFGAVAFWGGLSTMDGRTELRRALYCLINLGLVMFSLLVDRSIYLVLGALGFFGYLGHLAWVVFKDTLYFPFLLVLFGLSVMWLGLWYHKNRNSLTLWMESRMPRWFLRVREIRGDSSLR